jgi:hypothetical protein
VTPLPSTFVPLVLNTDDTGSALYSDPADSSFGLIDAYVEGQDTDPTIPGRVMWVPDPNNNNCIIVWLSGGVPSSAVTVLLEYPTV